MLTLLRLSRKMTAYAISILPTLSTISKKILHKQIYDDINTIFSKYLCGFRKGYNTQHCLLYMLECLRMAFDKGVHTGILSTDLTKVFHSLSRDLLVAKINSYGFSKLSLKMINDYINERKQRSRVNNNNNFP